MSGQAGLPADIRAIDVTRALAGADAQWWREGYGAADVHWRGIEGGALAGLPECFKKTAACRAKRRVGEIMVTAARDNLRKTLGALVQTSGEAAALGGPRCPR